ncbi:MAG: ATP-binding protein [Pseudomonadota bacterium]
MTLKSALSLVPRDPRTLWRRYVSALLAIVAIAGVIYAVNTTKARLQREIAVAINISGKQRMLSQRIAFYAGRVASQELNAAAASSEARLNDGITLFETHHKGLLFGSTTLGLNTPLSEELKDIYFGDTALDRRSRRYAELAHDVLSAPAGERPAAFNALLAANPDQLLVDLDRAVTSYENLAHNQEDKAVSLERLSLIAVLSVVILEALLIFIPAHFSIRRNLDEIARKAEENALLDQQRKSADAANCAKSNFLANMSHELRTPLNGILGMSQLMSQSALDETHQRYNKTILSCGQSLLCLINDILDMSKIEAGKLELTRSSFDLETLLQEALDTVSAAAEQKNLTLTLQVDQACAGRYVSDPVRLRQAVINLLGNAVKFTEEGGVTVTASIAAAKSGANASTRAVRLAVTDTGPGVTEAQQSVIFERFAQADDGLRKGAAGTGLGLSITAAIAEQLGGRAGVDSAVGRGSTFWIDVVLERDGGVDGVDAEAQHSSFAGVQSDRANPLTVLVADDNEVNRLVAQTALESHGHFVYLVANGADAIDALAVLPIDVAVLDLHMPVMDGASAARKIRQSKKAFADVPIIIASADAFVEAKNACIDAGADAFVSKPYDLKVLNAALYHVMNDRVDDGSASIDPAMKTSASA